MHADERNKGLSEQLGRDVYHYHLHVVYIPVVRTEVKWTKKCKDKSLIGTVKEVINQVSHSKKWECEKVIGEDGKEHLEYSYSKLQDRYHDHMKAAGFDGFERGKVGSTAKHLAAIEYKTMIRQEELAEKEKALAVAEEKLEQKTEKLSAVDKQLAQKENRVNKLTEKESDIQERIKSIEDGGQLLTLKQLETLPTKIHAPTFGKTGVILWDADYNNLRTTAMAAASANEQAKKYKSLAKTAYETIRDIVRAIGMLKFNFKGDMNPAANLTPEQNILIAAILNYGIDISKAHGYETLADEMKKPKLITPVSEIFRSLEEDYRKKKRPAFNETFAEAMQQVKEYDERKNNAPGVNRERKSYSAEL